MNRVIPFSILLGFMYALSEFPSAAGIPASAQTTLALGFIILAAHIVGELAALLKCPKITGYMLVGVFCGPYLLNLISTETVKELKLIDNIALGLIAFSAGQEMKLARLQRFKRSIISITFWVTLLEACGVSLIVWFLSGFWEPLRVASQLRVPLALVFGLLALAKSPITTIALIEETNVRNEFSHTVLGVVILKDIILIIAFSLMSSLLRHLTTPGSVINLETALLLGWRLLGSIACGVLLGGIITLYLNKIKLELGLFIVLVALLSIEAAHQLDLEPLLLCMSAGMFIENFSSEGESFLKGLRLGSPLIYPIFFAIAGASLNLIALQNLLLVTIFLLAVRAAMSFMGTYIGSRLVTDDPFMRRMGWLGLINQAGVTLALALLIESRLPELGKIATPVALGMIAASDFFAPPLFKWALLKSKTDHLQRTPG